VGLLPACVQCGGATMAILKIEPAEVPPAQPTMKFRTIEPKGTPANG
jgi:hypothetical protein